MRRKSGISLIETLIALLILALMGAAITAISLQVTAVNNAAKLQNQATIYAEEALEQARAYRQANGWVALAEKGTPAGCYYYTGTVFNSTSCISDPINCTGSMGQLVPGSTVHYRAVRFSTSGDRVTSESTVIWREKSACRKVTASTYFFNY